MEIVTTLIQRSSPALVVLVVNGFLLWCLWSLRKLFVRHEECEACRTDLQSFEQRFEKQARSYEQLTQRLDNVPKAKDLYTMSLDMAHLRGEQSAITADIKSLHAILERIEQPLALLMQHHLKA